MTVTSVRHVCRVLTILIAIALTQGCQTVTEGFTPQERTEITPFAQKTVEVIAVDNIQLRDDELLYLRQYVDDTFTELDRLQDLLKRVDVFRDRIITYSVELVRVSELYQTDAERVAAYADSLDVNFRDQVINNLEVSEQEWNAVLADVREQQDLLGALRAVQPILTKATEYYDRLMTDIETTVLFGVRAEFDLRIQAEYAELLEFTERYYRYRDETLDAINMLDDYERGDEDAYRRLREKNYVIGKILVDTDTPSQKQIDTMWRTLQEELTTNTEFGRNFDKDLDDYVATRSELDRKEAEVLADLSVARLQFVTWARAHQALANGVKEPGKWMELSIKAAQLVKEAAF
ncbi:MAG: hypothetical protein ACR2QV_03435 [Gammaproteobacteria bacterium]